MSTPPQLTPPAAQGSTIDAHAQANLRYIRASMDGARLLAIPGSAGIAMGLVGLGAAFAVSTTRLQQHWLSVWLAAAAVAGAVGGTLMVRQSRIHGHTLFGAPLRKFLLCLLPAIFAGAVLTAVEWGDGNVAAVPGIWLLLYGSALIAASATTTRFVGAMGALFVLLGGVAFLSPASTHNFLLATGFGGLHLVFGIFLGRLNHGR